MGCTESAEKKEEPRNEPTQDVDGERRGEDRSGDRDAANDSSRRSRSRRPSAAQRSVLSASSRSGAGGGGPDSRSLDVPSPRPPVPDWLRPDSEDSFQSSSSSVPQLFRMTPTNRTESGVVGTWEWWMEQVRREKITKDGISREHLQDLPNRLQCQRREDRKNVEMNLSQCYMERTAPYIIGSLLSSSHLGELQWVTSLRLDGNYFTDHGFGNLLATLSAANERHTVLPVLRHLYLNNMNLDRNLVSAIFSVIFPIDVSSSAAEELRIGHSVAPRSTFDPEILPAEPSKAGLFPSLTVLSLSDNTGLGVAGLVQVLRSLIAVHYESRSIAVLDLSRCGIGEPGLRFVNEFLDAVPRAVRERCRPVVPHRLLLLGNPLEGLGQGRGRGRSSAFGIRDPEIRVEL